jgi:hypothetical protein
MTVARFFLVAAFWWIPIATLIGAPQLPLINEFGTFPNGGNNLPNYINADVRSLAMNDEYVVVGMKPKVFGSPQAAFAFRRDTMELVHLLKPSAPDGMGEESFGTSVALSGSLAVIGSDNEHVQTPSGKRFNAGGAYVFDLVSGKEVARLVPNDPDGNTLFGESVAIDGTNVLLGGRANAAYLLRSQATS